MALTELVRALDVLGQQKDFIKIFFLEVSAHALPFVKTHLTEELLLAFFKDGAHEQCMVVHGAGKLRQRQLVPFTQALDEHVRCLIKLVAVADRMDDEKVVIDRLTDGFDSQCSILRMEEGEVLLIVQL